MSMEKGDFTMAKKNLVGFMVTIFVVISGDLPARADLLDSLKDMGGPLAILANGFFSRKQAEGSYKASEARDRASAGQLKENALSYFLARDAVVRRQDLLTQENVFFLSTYGRTKEVVVAMHNGLCGRKAADAEFVVDEGASSAGGKVMTVAEIKANLPSEHILLQSHLRGAGEKEGWQPALLSDDPSKFDGCIVIVDHLPAKIEVVGDVDSRPVNVAWYKDKKYVKSPDGDYQMNPDGTYKLEAKSKEELDQEVVQKGQYYYFLPLGYDIPVEASRLSLAVSIWDKEPQEKEQKPDEEAKFLLLKPDPTTPVRAGGTRVSVVPPIRRGVSGTAVAMSSSLMEALCGGGHDRVDDLKLAMLPAS